MSKKLGIQYFRNRGLLPFQAQFAVDFLESEEKPYQELVSPTGTGKMNLAAALIAYQMERGSNKRSLVLAPAQVLNVWQSALSSRLSSELATPTVVDRKTYLQMESLAHEGESPWPTPALILMSIDLAKRDDICASICAISWDLVILDEGHLLRGKRRVLYNSLTKSKAARRVLLLSISPSPFRAVVTKVDLQDVVDWNGRPIYIPFKKVLVPIYYTRTDRERALLVELEQFASAFTSSFRSLILQSAFSSIYSAGRMLRHLSKSWRFLRNKIAHNMHWTNEDLERIYSELSAFVEEPELVRDSPDSMGIPIQEFLTAYSKLESLLDGIEELCEDSKLDTLLVYLNDRIKDGACLCIWTSFATTAEYLHSNIQMVAERRVQCVTGGLDADERRNRLAAFQQDGGILILTDSAAEGVALDCVDECVNYDLPMRPAVLEQRWGRFLRIARKRSFKMTTLVDRSGASTWEEQVLKKLRLSG